MRLLPSEINCNAPTLPCCGPPAYSAAPRCLQRFEIETPAGVGAARIVVFLRTHEELLIRHYI